ncbi:MAG: hypothetical protein A2Z32_01625 [Chloroflexi bacterium RBG_16_69_14]|nr:MAG: hypothetical protein A2Z32_01625 [Chloroflexi bacterium RBG_16_69_14]
MATATVSVLLLYVNPLLGEGLEQLLAVEAGLTVTARQLGSAGTIDPDADVVIFEEGGPLGLEELLEQIHSPVVIVMSLHTDKVRILRLDDLRARPGNVVDTIVATCLDRSEVAPRAVGPGRCVAAGEVGP